MTSKQHYDNHSILQSLAPENGEKTTEAGCLSHLMD